MDCLTAINIDLSMYRQHKCTDLLFSYCMLCNTGWEEGLGLGAREQGIQEPIKGGEVRDKNDKYKVRQETHLPRHRPMSLSPLCTVSIGSGYGHAGSV